MNWDRFYIVWAVVSFLLTCLCVSIPVGWEGGVRRSTVKKWAFILFCLIVVDTFFIAGWPTNVH